MLILNIIFVGGGLTLLIFAALPHGRGMIPLHPVYGRLAGLFLVVAGITRFLDYNITRSLSDTWVFVILASLGILLLLIGLIAYKVRV